MGLEFDDDIFNLYYKLDRKEDWLQLRARVLRLEYENQLLTIENELLKRKLNAEKR